MCRTTSFVGHGCPTNTVAGHKWRKVSEKKLCRTPKSDKVTDTPVEEHQRIRSLPGICAIRLYTWPLNDYPVRQLNAFVV